MPARFLSSVPNALMLKAWQQYCLISYFYQMKVYGIKNCNTVAKALQWLQQHNIEFEFHDFKKSGVSTEKLNEWGDALGWEKLINKKGTTWKKLDAGTQASITNKDAAFSLMQEKTSVIKRPVIETDRSVLLGFDEATYTESLLP